MVLWQEEQGLVTRRAWAYGKKSKGLWQEVHGLMTERACSYSEFHQWNTPEGPALTRRRSGPYELKDWSFRVDHHGDPPNTPWRMCQPSIVSRPTLYSVSPNPL